MESRKIEVLLFSKFRRSRDSIPDDEYKLVET